MRLGQIFEIICDRGEAVPERWSVGSGYLVRNQVVLTAAHVVYGAVAVSVRRQGDTEFPATVLLATGPDVDFAVLAVPGVRAEQPAAYGMVSRETPGRIADCRTIGFPRFKEVRRDGRRIRDSVQVDGYLPSAEGLVSGYLTLRADTSPRELAGAESAWSGMSGAAVFAGETLVGVVTEHHLVEGEGSLTVSPLNRIDRCDPVTVNRFWRAIGVAAPSSLPRLAPEAVPKGMRAQTGTLLALPKPLSDFTGRQSEVKQLCELLSAPREGRAAVIWGPPGVGKSQLAVHVAHELLTEHADGACLIDLQGYSANRLSPELVAARLLDTLSPAREIPADPAARFAACRAMLRDGDYVVVLDNANATTQVRDVLPGAGTTVVLVTSRSPMSTLDASLVELDLLDTASGVRLIRAIVERDGPHEPGSAGDLTELVGMCGNLPLALRIAGALLRARPNWTVRRLLDRLGDESRRLALLERDDLAVRPVFDSGYAALDETAQRLFGLLGSVGALRIAPWMAVALLDTDPDTAEEVLERLVDAQLLRSAGPDLAGTFRYRFHDLVRLYAREKLATFSSEEICAAERRMLSGYLALALEYTRRHPIAANYEFARTVELPWSAPDQPVPPDPMEWLLEERGDLVAEIEHAYAAGEWPCVWGLADILDPVFILSNHGTESRRVKELALAAAHAAGDAGAELQVRFSFLSALHDERRFDEVFGELDDLRAERLRRGEKHQAAHMALILGVVQRTACKLKASEESLRLSLGELIALPEPDDPVVTAMIASAQQNLAIACREQGRLAEADGLLNHCLAAFKALDDAIAYGRGMHTRGVLCCYLGRYDDAAAAYAKAHELSRSVGDRRWTAIAVLSAARLASRRGLWAEAARLLDEADALFAAISDAAGRAQVLRTRAVLLRVNGRYEEAERVFDTAHDALQAVPDRRSLARLHYSRALMELARGRPEDTLAQLDLADARLTDEDDMVWRCRVRVTRFRAHPGMEDPVALAAELDRFAALAGAGFLPLWITEARRHLDA